MLNNWPVFCDFFQIAPLGLTPYLKESWFWNGSPWLRLSWKSIRMDQNSLNKLFRRVPTHKNRIFNSKSTKKDKKPQKPDKIELFPYFPYLPGLGSPIYPVGPLGPVGPPREIWQLGVLQVTNFVRSPGSNEGFPTDISPGAPKLGDPKPGK